MNQHPIPQNVTGYQFRLIGDMTIQQFVYLSVGIGAAIFFYYTNLFSLIKWFFVLLSAMTGFAVAFLPLEERPLDQWLVNYIKAVYRPTRFIWGKKTEPPAYFSFTPNNADLPIDSEELSRVAAIRKQQGLRSYLVTLPSDQQETIDHTETSALASIVGLFSPTNDSPFVRETGEPPRELLPTPSFSLPSLQPAEQPVVTEMLPPIPEPVIVNEVLPQSTAMATEDVSAPSVAATTSSSLPFPSTPTTPNTVVGMVLDNEGKIIDGVIVEVVDSSGLPVRATKTNQLGQFFSTTPLRTGTYRIAVEKAGLSFDTIELVVSGQIIPPLKIQAK